MKSGIHGSDSRPTRPKTRAKGSGKAYGSGHAESGQTFENVAVPRFIMPALSCRRAFRRLDEIAHHPLFRLLPGTDELQANPSVKNI